MKRVFDIAVVAIATLGVVSVGLAACCPTDEGTCTHARGERTDASHDESHCAPEPESSPLALEAVCCGGPDADSPEYGLTKPLPLPGAPMLRSDAPPIAAAGAAAPRLAPILVPSRAQRSPILRL